MDGRAVGGVVATALSTATFSAAVRASVVAGGGGEVARAAVTGVRLVLVQYPGAGFGGVEQQIAGARRTIDMEIYELADPTVERDLVAAAARGVEVRVLLDRAYTGGSVNAPASGYLRAYGVHVRWGPTGTIFHIKTTTFDGATSDISTANLVARYETTDRDAEIVDTDPVQVHAIQATFTRDWAAAASGAGVGPAVVAPGLVWSPASGSVTAEAVLAAQITAARDSVDFESEELSDPAIIAALAADGRRGVDCRIVMMRDPEWASAFTTVSRAGCHVHLLPERDGALYIHEKLILDDAGTPHASMFLGSQNASVTSLTRNRELGIVLRGGSGVGAGAAISAAAGTFNGDFAQAEAWSPAW